MRGLMQECKTNILWNNWTFPQHFSGRYLIFFRNWITFSQLRQWLNYITMNHRKNEKLRKWFTKWIIGFHEHCFLALYQPIPPYLFSFSTIHHNYHFWVHYSRLLFLLPMCLLHAAKQRQMLEEGGAPSEILALETKQEAIRSQQGINIKRQTRTWNSTGAVGQFSYSII